MVVVLVYGLDKNLFGEKNVLIYDLGGGIFDVLIFMIDEGLVFEVQFMVGDIYLGGEDFDNRMVDYFVKEFKRKYQWDIMFNNRVFRRLCIVCERVKRIFFSSIEVSIEIDFLYDGVDYYIKIICVRFEELCFDLFKSMMEFVERVLMDVKLDKLKIYDIVLVGGFIRIFKI